MGIEGRTILFTGTLLQLKRADAAKKASKAGATVAASFNKSVDLVIAGQDSGSKLDKARDQGVEIWDEEAFIAAVDGSGGASSGSAPVPAPAPAAAAKRGAKKAAPPPPADDPVATSFSVPSRGKFSSPGRKIDRALKNGAIPYNKKSTSINGKSITFTGKISLKRAEATAMAEKEGAHVQSSITKSTQIVVAASDAGNKLDKAKDLGLEIWSENDFREACGLAREDEDDDDDEDGEDEEEEESGGGGGGGKKQKSVGAATKKLEIPSNLLKEVSDSVDAKNIVFLGGASGSAQLDTLKVSAESSGANVQGTANAATDILVLLDFSPDVVTKARELGVGDVEVWSLEHLETVCQAAKAKRDQEAQKRAEEQKIERGEDSDEDEDDDNDDDDDDDDKDDEDDEDGDGEDKNDADLTLDGRNLLFTGTLKLMKRADATKRAILAGATVLSSFTKAVDLVVSGGDDAGAKLDKARDQGIEIWTEQQFASALEKLGEAQEGSSSDPVKGKAVKAAPGSKRKRGAAAADEDEENETAAKAATVETAKDDSGDASTLEGKNVCFTGTLLQLKRADASKQAVAAGAKVLSSITKACNLVVAGADAGSKLDKARDSGIEIWSEEKFLEIVQGGGSSAASPGKKARA
ncbi:hypothetical protein HDU77_003349 [Chytriomyces hyalinus]|nr:hypothetical protein HDU77_003349 [Chytriomyces hyalinus]